MLKKQDCVNAFGPEWTALLKDVLRSDYMQRLVSLLDAEYAMNEILPEKSKIFDAFLKCPLKDLKVVVIGQEPSKMSGAYGLAYGGDNYLSSPPLATGTVLKCIERDYYEGFNLNLDYSLVSYARQGVLFLNKNLTCRKEEPLSHDKYWSRFFKSVLKTISENKTGIIFVIWEQEYMKKEYTSLMKNGHILSSTTPSCLKYIFNDWESKNFEEINAIIEKQNGKEFKIKW